MVSRELRFIKLFIISTILFLFSGVFSLIAAKMDYQILRLWKELLIILLFFYAVFVSLLKRKIYLKNFFVIFFLLMPLFLFYILFNLDRNQTLIFYQIKNDLVPLLFPVSIFLIIKDRISLDFLIKNYIRTIVIISLINVIIIFIQVIYTDSFLIYLAIEQYNNQSSASGLRLDNTLGSLRAMGTMISFINSGTLCLFAIFMLMETNYYKGLKKILFLFLIIAAAIATTYKTLYIALTLYFFIKIIFLFFRNNMHKKIILLIMTIFCFAFFAFIFNNFYFYDNYFKGTENQGIAYNSIYLRVFQHQSIIDEMDNNDSLLTGLGIGKHGTEGPPELKYNSKALDSTFSNLMSNYGTIGCALIVFLFFILLIYFIMTEGVLNNLACFLIFYSLGIEFFANNFLMNFPPNIIFYTLITLAYLSVKYKKNIYLNDSGQ